MSDNTATAIVKQEIEISCCSPSPSSGNIQQPIIYSPQDNVTKVRRVSSLKKYNNNNNIK